MKEQRALIPLALGAVGLILGVIALVSSLPWLGLFAGAAALGAGALGYQAGTVESEASTKSVPSSARSSATAGNDTASLEAQITELEGAVAAQVQARLAAEEAVKSLGEQLAQSQAQRPSAPAGAAPTAQPSGATASGALTDNASGLFSEDYFRVSVDARIAAARRHLRPVAVALVSVVAGDPDSGQFADPAIVGPVLIETLRDSDTACRLSDGRYGLVLEDTPENGAIWTLERIRRSLGEQQDGLVTWAGLACYPAHAFDGSELMRQAEQALTDAREWRQDRIEVATADT